MAENIQKSFRLPADLVEYIEQQEGRNFSDKLISLLDECRIGEEKRQKSIERYEQYVEECRKLLEKQRILSYRTQSVMQRYDSVVSDAIADAEALTLSRDRPPASESSPRSS